MNAQATRAEIIRVAREAFTVRGYSLVKLGDVARAAHATTGAIYHHFGGKAGLLLAVGEHVEQEVVAAIAARVPADAAPRDALRTVAAATLELCSRPEVAGIIFREAPNVLGREAWREIEMRYGLGGLHQLFDRASAAGELRPDHPAVAARLFMAILAEGVAAIVDDPRTANVRAVRAIVEGALEALFVR